MSRTRRMRPLVLCCAVAVLLASTGSVSAADASAPPSGVGSAHAASPVSREDWVWPLTAFRLTNPYVAPAHAYGPGHRGIDLAPASLPAIVRTPASGVVAFSGPVAGRGILTIDHGDGLVTTLEPVTSDLEPGARVARGNEVAALALGGHAAAGTLHFGVRLHGEYINPMLLLGGVPRAVLLPCC